MDGVLDNNKGSEKHLKVTKEAATIRLTLKGKMKWKPTSILGKIAEVCLEGINADFLGSNWKLPNVFDEISWALYLLKPSEWYEDMEGVGLMWLEEERL